MRVAPRRFQIRRGKELYYWEINRLLGQTSLALRLATSGEDRGRLLEAVEDARNNLVVQTIGGAEAATRDPLSMRSRSSDVALV